MRLLSVDVERVAARKGRLLDTYVDGLISRAEFEDASNRYGAQLEALKKRLLALEQGNETVETLMQRLEKLEAVIEDLARLKEFGDSVCSELLRRVVVEGGEKISFYLAADKNADMFVKMPLSFSKGYHHMQQYQNSFAA